jgi:alginate O-acetyltransferase complex protein AlgI
MLTTIRNLLIVFLLTGLWHGAAWTFVLWGLFHGIFLLLERIGVARFLDRLPSLVGRAYTILIVVFGWVLFRATDPSQATTLFSAMIGVADEVVPLASPQERWLSPEVKMAWLAGVTFSVPTLPWLLDRCGWPRLGRLDVHRDPRYDILYEHALPGWLLLLGLVVCVALLATGSLNPFLYFRF